MPEIPDLDVYVNALNERLVGAELKRMTIVSPFLLRTVSPPVDALLGRQLLRCLRMAKQLVFQLEGEYAFVLHLMISGRLQWSDTYKAPPKRNGLAAFEFSTGTVTFTGPWSLQAANPEILVAPYAASQPTEAVGS